LSAKAICDVCHKEEGMEATPLGVAMMPKMWFCTVRQSEDTLVVVDVCSQQCAEAFDKSQGRNETLLEELQDGEPVLRTLEHKADN